MMFGLSDIEQKRFRKFEKKIIKKFGNDVLFSFCFKPIGIGVELTVVADVITQKENKTMKIVKNITDLSSW